MKRAIAVVAILAVAGAVAIEVARSYYRKTGKGLAISISLDVSDQTEQVIDRYADWAFRIQRNLPDASVVRVNTFGHDVQRAYTGPPIHTWAAFKRQVVPSLVSPTGTIRKPQTRTEDLLLNVAKDEVRPAFAWVVTDGGIEVVDDVVDIKIWSAMRMLGRESAFKQLAVIGVKPEYRLIWEKWLKGLGNRAVVRGTLDAEPVLNLAEREVQ